MNTIDKRFMFCIFATVFCLLIKMYIILYDASHFVQTTAIDNAENLLVNLILIVSAALTVWYGVVRDLVIKTE